MTDNTLAEINTQLRKAVLDCFPCAYEQYVCIQMPGTIIDTRLGGAYISKGERITADIRNMIQCNEAMLVDSMVPLDKVMLGPTGKSVTRSYMTALDMLVPRKTEIGSLDTEPDLGNNDNSTKYAQAMKFLRSKETILTPKSAILGSRLRNAKDQMEVQGFPGTVVDRYVEKQIAWSEARGKWDAVRSEALEARELGDETQQSAAMFSARQKDLKRTQGELHARWMDWVVNGDKFRVEYCFSIVDSDSIMARIERGREATRDSLLTSIDGTEWAQVTLEPRHWAQLCRAKAVDWKTRNPTNPAHLQLRLDSLKRMQQAYEVYRDHMKNRGAQSPPKKSWESMTAEWDGYDAVLKSSEKSDDDKKDAKIKQDSLRDLYNALKQVKEKKDELDAKQKAIEKIDQDGEGTPEQRDARKAPLKDALNKLETEHKQLQDDAAAVEATSPIKGDHEAKRKNALEDVNTYEAEVSKYTGNKDETNRQLSQDKLDQAKKKWTEANLALQEVVTKESIANIEGDGIRTLKTSINGQLTSIAEEMRELKEKLSASAIVGPAAAPSVITGVGKDNELVKDGYQSEAAQGGSSAPEETADVWTKVAFNVSSKSDSASTKESHVSASANLSVGRWWSKVQASTSFSASSKEVQKKMSSCSVSGSFSAMVVNIKRPWLHSELFQDFDVDIPTGTKLSPGAQQIKEWVEKGDPETGANKRTEYGKFPAYPTAFIVAADTVLEFKTTTENSTEMMKSLTTDSSIQASYGPWGLKCGASAKTSNSESAQNMSVKDGALTISFQAPQIIGWVSEILPQLPSW